MAADEEARSDARNDGSVPAQGPVPDWWIYRCVPEPHDGIMRLPSAPPWRSFTEGRREDLLDTPGPRPSAAEHRRLGRNAQAALYQADREEIHLVNMALLLRRPLLVTGPPGVGKSTLAYSIARELRLGPVLRWPVTSRTTLQDGQYQYDAIGRLQDVGLGERLRGIGEESRRPDAAPEPPDIGRYLRLGPLGTAFLAWRSPRVLLIDEIDKSDVDFPNDLLHIFEEGEFTIPELLRLTRSPVRVMTADDEQWVELHRGRVRCHEFPIIVMTSNGERDFPPAFMRRCIRLEIPQPSRSKLTRLLAAHLPTDGGPSQEIREALISEFLRKRDQDSELANDQLLNAVQLAQQLWNSQEERSLIVDHALRPLNGG